jgi:hypothetical protein
LTGFLKVLLRGCRCLEIDVWDGEPPSRSSSDAGETSTSHSNDKEGGRRAQYKARLSSKLDHFAKKLPSPVSPRRGSSPHRDIASAATAAATAAARTVLGGQIDEPLERWRSEHSTRRAEPQVLHGYTLTKEVPFRDVCWAIRDAAFVTSELPIIVSLEVHASLEQQEIMIEIMKEAWKGLLVEVPSVKEGGDYALPSLETLKRKILIKVKWMPSEKDKSGEGPGAALERMRTVDSEEDERAPPVAVGVNPEKRKKPAKLLQALSELGIYTRGYHFKSLNSPGRLCSEVTTGGERH